MKNKIILAYCLLNLIIGFLAFSAVYGLDDISQISVSQDDIVFQIADLMIYNPQPAEFPPEVKEWPVQKSFFSPQLSCLAIGVKVVNLHDVKKLNLNESLEFELRDEYDNVYKKLPPPEDFDGAAFIPNLHYPSMYPGEYFVQTVFFEPPIPRSQNLFLRITAPDMGITEPVKLTIPTEKITPHSLDDFEAEDENYPAFDDLTVEVPDDLTAVPGQTLKIRIALKDTMKKPDAFYVILPDYVLEDTQLAMNYRLQIPSNQPLGPYPVIILAKWNKTFDPYTISKSFSINVVDPAEICRKHCQEKKGQSFHGDAFHRVKKAF